MSYGIYLLNIKALQISYGSFFQEASDKTKMEKMSHLFSYGCIAGIKQRAEMLQARRGVQQGSRAKEGPGVSDSIAKQVVKRFLSFSVCDENITFRASWFGHAAYTAVGYQFVTVSHFSPSTNTPSLYSQLCFTAQKSIL